jgi:putative ABC transport system substrate-binding protein
MWQRLPATGGLMACGVDFDAVQRRTARYVDNILRGAKPGEPPIERPPRFVPTSAAHERGSKVPQTPRLRADGVIQ